MLKVANLVVHSPRGVPFLLDLFFCYCESVLLCGVVLCRKQTHKAMDWGAGASD